MPYISKRFPIETELVGVLLAASIFFGLSFFLHHPMYNSPWYYSDIIWAPSLVDGRAAIRNGLIPYIDFGLEYPVLSGLIFYVSSRFTYDPPYGFPVNYYRVTSLILYFFVMGSVFLIYKLCELHGVDRNRILVYCLCTPSFAFFTIYTFDWVGNFFLFLALYLFLSNRSKYSLVSAVALGLGIASRIMPLLCIPFFLLELKDWRDRINYALTTFLGWLVPNAYFMLKNFDLFLYTYRFQATIWGIEDSWLIFLFERTNPMIYLFGFPLTKVSNLVSAVLLFYLFSRIVLDGRKLNLVQRCFLILLAFVVTSFKFPPQYMLMLTPFFALTATVSYPVFITADLLDTMIILWWFEPMFRLFDAISASSPVQWISAIRQALLFLTFLKVLYPERFEKFRSSTSPHPSPINTMDMTAKSSPT